MRLSLPAATCLAVATLATTATAQGLDLSGYARFGLQYTEDATGGWNDGEVAPTSRFRLNLRARTTTDGGAGFEARVRAQASNTQSVVFNAPRFTVSGGGVSVQLGNISGAFADTPGIDDRIGLTGLSAPDKAARTRGREAYDDYDSRGAGAAANNGVQVGYRAGAFTAALSYSDRNPAATSERRRRTGGHLSWSDGGYTLAVGFQDSDLSDEDFVLVSAEAAFDGYTVDLQAADNRGVKKVVLRGSLDVTPQAMLTAFVSRESGNPTASEQWNGTGGGVGVSYALGGGADFQAGVVRRSDSRVLADAGVIFRF
ncbi:MAG: porin [Alkalilacustris sp.]